MRRMVGPEPPSAAANGRAQRSLATAYLVWFLLGIFGAHRFYLGDARAGRRFLIALGVGVALPIIGLALALSTRSFEGVSIGLIGWLAGLLVLLGVLLTAILDAFRLPALTRRANADRDPSQPQAGHGSRSEDDG
jgi:TM2 domain-containing membrane protein YozV